MLDGAAPDRRASGDGGDRREAPGGAGPRSPRVREQMDAGDAGQSSTTVAARPGTEEEAGRGSEEHAARPDAGDETGRGGTEDAAQPGAGGGETDRDASELPASQTEGDTPTPEPTGTRDEGAAAAAMAQTAVVVVSAEVPAEETPAAAAPRL